MEPFLRKLFLQQQLRHQLFLRNGLSTDTSITNYNSSPKFVAKTEWVAICHSTAPASCGIASSRNIRLGMSDHGCDGSEGLSTVVTSAMLHSQMVWRLIHGYGLRTILPPPPSPKLSLEFYIRWHVDCPTFLSMSSLHINSQACLLSISVETFLSAFFLLSIITSLLSSTFENRVDS